MKKLFSFFLAILLILTMATACRREETPQDQGQIEQPKDETPGDNQNENKEKGPEAVTTPSIVDNNEAFKEAISADGTWIICTLKDLTFDEELIVEGEFHNKDDPSQEIYRKIALYAQDENRNVTDRFTLTAPRMIIRSENTKIQGGTFVGDIYVEANGFTVQDGTIQGNVYFAKEEYKNSFNLAEGGKVTGATEVKELEETQGQ